MKRSISTALILALLGMIAFSLAFAEELEVVNEDIEAAVSEIDLADASEFVEESIEGAHQQAISDIVEETTTDVVASNAIPETNEAETLVATGIELSASSVSIGVKEKYNGLAVRPLPEGSALPAVSWRSSNKKIAKVSSSGVITGVKKGSATIYAKMAGSDVEVKCKITVKSAPKKVSVKPATLILGIGMTCPINASVASSCASGSYTYHL